MSTAAPAAPAVFPRPAVPILIVVTCPDVAGVFDTAFSQESAAAKLAALSKQFSDLKFDVTENALVPIAEEDKTRGELTQLRHFKQAVIDNTGTDDPHRMAKAFRAFEKLSANILALDQREAELDARELALRAPDAIAEKKFKFKAGDFVQDEHSDTVIHVERIGAEAFAWLNPQTGDRGEVPHSSAQYYKKVSAAVKKKHLKKMAALNKPAPQIDAITGESPVFPFGVGDTVKDQHTGAHVKITAVGPDAKLNTSAAGNGFDWAHTDPTAKEQSGHVPINAVGNFDLVGKRVSTLPAKKNSPRKFSGRRRSPVKSAPKKARSR